VKGERRGERGEGRGEVKGERWAFSYWCVCRSSYDQWSCSRRTKGKSLYKGGREKGEVKREKGEGRKEKGEGRKEKGIRERKKGREKSE
jgi:hypothetical protein